MQKPIDRRSNVWRFAGAFMCLIGTAVGVIVGVANADLPGWRDYPAWFLIGLSVVIPFWAIGLPLILVPTFTEFRRAGILQAAGQVGRQLVPWARYNGPPPPPDGSDQHPQV